MKHVPELGNLIGEHGAVGPPCKIDVDRLIISRLLIQAGSGGGKSCALRRVLEQTAGLVQQIVIDPDGEFASLREKFDYVIAAPQGGDALAHPKTAALLARRLLETGVSAILDIYDLPKRDRQSFVRIFCETMMDAPKSLWHPVLVVIDEAHVYSPEKDEAEASSAVIDLASRGRKRGYALVAATQRISKLSKDCAAELHNKMIGLATLDLDVKRAAFELGLPPAEAMRVLRSLEPGEFYVVGPAFGREAPRQVRVGSVGMAALPNAEPLPTGEDLQRYWFEKLPEGERAILKVLVREHPAAIARDTLDSETGFKRSTRDAYLQRLAAKELVMEPTRGQVRAVDQLFD